MARPVTPRPASEHHATLSRMVRQVEADDEIHPRRRARLKYLMSELLTEFQKEMLK